MSSKTSKSAAADTKSKTKALLLMLEKLVSGSNPDKEQMRLLCHKLLHMANSHETSRKEVSSKNGLEVVLTILESCGDQTTCLTLVNILSEIAAGNGLKRLVNHDVTRVLLHTVAYLGKEADNRLLCALIGLSVKIAPKDRRFALRVRLSGALPILVSIIRSSTSHTPSNKLLLASMHCLKICASSSVNASIMGRLGAVNVFQKLIVSLGRKQPSMSKTALSTLSLLVKSSRSNARNAVTNGVITNMLAIHQEWHKYDYKSHKHIPARKSMLNILKHLTVTRKGRNALIEAGGMRILHRTSKECTTLSCPKAAESLLTVATLILRRCQPRLRLPIPTVQCTFKFPLPQTEEKTCINIHLPTPLIDDVIDASDDDEDEDEVASDIQELENQELLEEQKEEDDSKISSGSAAPLVIPPACGGVPLKRSASDLKSMYEKYFPELLEFQCSDYEEEACVQHMIDCTAYLNLHLLRRYAESTQLDGSEQVSCGHNGVNGRSHRFSRVQSEGNVFGTQVKIAALNHPSTAPAPSLQGGDEHSSLMASFASTTKSCKQAVNTVSLADYFGHIPPSIGEQQIGKKYGIQRVKLLEDIARTLKYGDIVNKVVYSRDIDYKPPKSDQCGPYEVESSGSNLDILKEVLKNSLDDEMVTAVFQDPVNLEERAPVIKDACDFTMNGGGLPERQDFFGYQENSSIISSLNGLPFGQKPPLNFRSDFECGNLRTAIQVRRNEYDLILDADCNTNHHHQWFYFEVSRISSGIPYRFNIVNCEKSSSQFNAGMQPLMFSVSEAQLGNPCWRRVGSDVCYYKSNFSRSSASAGGVKGKSYFTMTFTVTFLYEEDVCYFAYHFPYTYTQLNADLHQLVGKIDEKEMYCRVQTLCSTIGENPVPVLTVTAPPDFSSDKDEEEVISEFRSRPYVFLSARVHPGESNSSWTMRGTLKLLLSSKSPDAEQLRKSFIFKIVPMLNPDGVINGHHRCSLSGEDLNRQWIDPDVKLFPTIYHTKGLLQYLKSIGKAPLVYCDYHGHSRRKNVFMYGCSRKESVIAGETDALSGAPDDAGFRTLPKLLNRMAPAFSISNCSFVVEKCKESTARVVVWKEIGVARSYTMESTYCGCDQGKYKGSQIGTQELEEMGMILCEAMLQLKSKERARRLPMQQDQILSDEEYFFNSDLSMSDHPSLESEARQKVIDWEAAGEYSGSGSDYAAPANSDEEFTPDEIESFTSCKAVESDDTLIAQYPQEFWDYNEYCKGYGFGQEEDDESDITPRAVQNVMSSNGLHHNQSDSFVMGPPYRVCPDTGRILYENDDPSDLMLAAMMERNGLYDKTKSMKS